MYNKLLKNDLEHIVAQMEGFLEQLKGKRVFVAGGTGFFGKWILETFAFANGELDLQTEIVILTRNINKFRKTNGYFFDNDLFSFIEGDIRDFIFPEGKFDFIIHGATDSGSDIYKKNPLMLFDIIVEGTRHILDFGVKCGAKSILFISSGAVYGKQPVELSLVTEEYSGGPVLNTIDSAYPEGKRAAEMLCYLYSSKYDLPVKIARCFAFVGPYLPMDQHFAIGNFIKDRLENEPLIIKGDGTPLRSYLYTADLTVWLLTILLKGRNCIPYNVGSEDGISIADLAERVSKIKGEPLEIRILTRITNQSGTEKYLPSTSRARKELGLSQIVDIDDSITRTIEFHQALGRIN